MSEHKIKIVVDRQNKHGTDFYYPVCELSKTLVKLKGNTKKVLTKSDMFLLIKLFDINLKEQKVF
jgi:hypothetical protein